MIAPRWRKVLRELWLNKTRTVLVVLSIAVGVFAMGALGGARTILERDLAIQYEASHEASMSIAASNLDEAFIRSIVRMPEVEDAQGRSVYFLRAPLGDTRSNVILFALADFNDVRLDRFVPQAGAAVPGRREVLLERSTLRMFNKQIGDLFTVELPDGKTRDLRIVGTVFDVNAPPVRFANFGSAYISLDTLEWLGFPRAYTQMRVRVAEKHTDRAHIQQVADVIKKRIEDSGRTFYSASIPQSPGRHYANDQLQSMLLILVAVGALSLFLSAFLVINTTMTLISQQIRQIGIMKALGGRETQITSLYLTTVALFGAFSLLIAVPLGTLGAYVLVSFVADLLNFTVLTRFPPPEVLLLEIGVGLLLPLMAALAPVLGGMRITVREALTFTGAQESHAIRRGGALATLRNRLASALDIERWVSRPFLLSIRNTFRRKQRLALTIGTLMLASAIFVSVFSVRDSLYRTLNTSLRYWQYDIEVTLANPQGDMRALNAVRNVEGVVYAEAWHVSSARRVRADGSQSRTINLTALPADSPLVQPTLLAGRWILPSDARQVVVNTEVLADEPDLQLGDELRLKIGSREWTFYIVGVAESALSTPIRNGRVIYANRDGFRDLLGIGRQTQVLAVVSSQHDALYQSQVAQRLEDALRSANMSATSTETIAERREQLTFQFELVIIFLLITAALLALVGGLGLASTMSMNVLERTREIGVMRAIGASDRALYRIIIGEGVFIGLISWFLGSWLALPISILLCEAVGHAFLRRPLEFEFSVLGVGVWLLAMIALSAISSLFPAVRASRLTVREVLAYE